MERIVKVLQEELKYWQDFAYKAVEEKAQWQDRAETAEEKVQKLQEIIANKRQF